MDTAAGQMDVLCPVMLLSSDFASGCYSRGQESCQKENDPYVLLDRGVVPGDFLEKGAKCLIGTDKLSVRLPLDGLLHGLLYQAPMG
jgi:hypothetical protein